MKKVKVVNIQDKYVLTLEDTDQKRYRRNIEFYDIDINVGDYIVRNLNYEYSIFTESKFLELFDEVN